ncbi:MAG: polysaccharide deacetylase family protein [Bacteroidota bacterium]
MLKFPYAFWITVWCFFILNILKFTIDISYWWYVLLFSTFFSMVFWGTSRVHSQFLIKAFCRYPSDKKLISLTFDDGPHPINTPKILDILKEANLKACFFVIGKNAYQFPEIIGRMDEDGHLIGNHSFSHSKIFDFFSAKRMKDELLMTNSTIKKITGKEMMYFRPPFGVTTLSMRSALRKLPFTVIGWSNRSLDTVIKDENKIYQRIISCLSKHKNIVLMHDTQDCSVIVLEKLIEYLKANEYQVILPDDYLNTPSHE